MKYRKKPVVIEAMQFSTENHAEVCDWISANGGWVFWVAGDVTGGERIDIQTLEGVMAARPGDWIIKGVKGEFYPVKSDVFDQTYEAVTE